MNRNSIIVALAATLYSNYCAAVGGKAFNGDPLPSADEFFKNKSKSKQSDAWISTAERAVEEFFPNSVVGGDDPEALLRHEVFIDKSLRRSLGLIADVLDYHSPTQGSRERSAAKTKVQEAGFWLGANLGEIRKRGEKIGISLAESPYPRSRDPQSPVVHPHALDQDVDLNAEILALRGLLGHCKNRFETIKETVPGIALDDTLRLIDDKIRL